MLAVSSEDDVHVGAEDTLCNLHGDVPGDIFVFEPMNEPHGAGDGDGTLENTVIFCLTQKVHAKLVNTLLRVFGGYSPLPLGFKLLACLHLNTEISHLDEKILKKRITHVIVFYILTSSGRELNAVTT